MSLCSKWYDSRIRIPSDKLITFKYSLTIWTSAFTLFFIHEVFSLFFLLKFSAKMKLRVNFLPFIRQNKALYKAGWRNLFIFARNLPIVFNNLFLFQWRWSGLHEDHDIQLAIEVLGSEPYCFKPWDMWARLPAVRAVERAKIWQYVDRK